MSAHIRPIGEIWNWCHFRVLAFLTRRRRRRRTFSRHLGILDSAFSRRRRRIDGVGSEEKRQMIADAWAFVGEFGDLVGRAARCDELRVDLPRGEVRLLVPLQRGNDLLDNRGDVVFVRDERGINHGKP